MCAVCTTFGWSISILVQLCTMHRQPSKLDHSVGLGFEVCNGVIGRSTLPRSLLVPSRPPIFAIIIIAVIISVTTITMILAITSLMPTCVCVRKLCKNYCNIAILAQSVFPMHLLFLSMAENLPILAFFTLLL